MTQHCWLPFWARVPSAVFVCWTLFEQERSGRRGLTRSQNVALMFNSRSVGAWPERTSWRRIANWVCIFLTDSYHYYEFDIGRDEIDHHSVKQYVQAYVIGPLCLVGIAMNLVGMYLLGRDSSIENATRFLLRMLAVADVAFLVTSSILIVISHVVYFEGYLSESALALVWSAYIIASVIPFWWITFMATVWLVILVAAERYVVAWRPLLAIRYTTVPRLRLAVIIVWVGSIAFSVPRFFEHQVEQNYGFHLEPTTLAMSASYHIIYRMLLCFLVHFVLPFSFLVFFVHRLVQSVRQDTASQRRLQHLQQTSDVSDERRTVTIGRERRSSSSFSCSSARPSFKSATLTVWVFCSVSSPGSFITTSSPTLTSPSSVFWPSSSIHPSSWSSSSPWIPVSVVRCSDVAVPGVQTSVSSSETRTRRSSMNSPTSSLLFHRIYLFLFDELLCIADMRS